MTAPLRDVDTARDAWEVAGQCPDAAFAAAVRRNIPVAVAGDHRPGPLRRGAARGRRRPPGALDLVDPTTSRPARQLAPGDWCADRTPGDGACSPGACGPTLDIGCGPGRLVAALTALRVPALGVDVSAEAVRQARRRGRRCTARLRLRAGRPARAVGGTSCSSTATSASAATRSGCSPGAASSSRPAATSSSRSTRPGRAAGAARSRYATTTGSAARSHGLRSPPTTWRPWPGRALCRIVDRWTEARRCFARLG